MRIQAYIESGILEEYVLGTVSPQEKQEVECMTHIYPELKEALRSMEMAMEQYAMKQQKAPPSGLKEAIFANLNFDEKREGLNQKDETSDNQKAEKPTRPLLVSNEAVNISPPFWTKLVAAASIILAVFAGWSSMKISEVTKEKDELGASMEVLRQDIAYKDQLARLYRNPSLKLVHMTGLDKSPASAVNVFWNKQTNDVVLDVQNLPKAPAGKQYQLWSIVDGKPVDIGMLAQEWDGKILKMKPTKSASVAFAITLEKEGGSPSPTMEEMYVMGEVKV